MRRFAVFLQADAGHSEEQHPAPTGTGSTDDVTEAVTGHQGHG